MLPISTNENPQKYFAGPVHPRDAEHPLDAKRPQEAR